MGLKDKLQAFKEAELTFTLPDGSVIELQPVSALKVIPRLGLPPQVLQKFFSAAKSGAQSEVEQRMAIQRLVEDEDMVQAGLKWDESYWVEGIVALDGEPVKLVFSHEQPEGDEIKVSVFKAFIASNYGQEVVDDLTAAIYRVSGYILPEEVQADAEAFQDLARHAAHAGEGVRDEPGGHPEDAAGGAGSPAPDSPGGGSV